MWNIQFPFVSIHLFSYFNQNCIVNKRNGLFCFAQFICKECWNLMFFKVKVCNFSTFPYYMGQQPAARGATCCPWVLFAASEYIHRLNIYRTPLIMWALLAKYNRTFTDRGLVKEEVCPEQDKLRFETLVFKNWHPTPKSQNFQRTNVLDMVKMFICERNWRYLWIYKKL